MDKQKSVMEKLAKPASLRELLTEKLNLSGELCNKLNISGCEGIDPVLVETCQHVYLRIAPPKENPTYRGVPVGVLAFGLTKDNRVRVSVSLISKEESCFFAKKEGIARVYKRLFANFTHDRTTGAIEHCHFENVDALAAMPVMQIVRQLLPSSRSNYSRELKQRYASGKLSHCHPKACAHFRDKAAAHSDNDRSDELQYSGHDTVVVKTDTGLLYDMEVNSVNPEVGVVTGTVLRWTKAAKDCPATSYRETVHVPMAAVVAVV